MTLRRIPSLILVITCLALSGSWVLSNPGADASVSELGLTPMAWLPLVLKNYPGPTATATPTDTLTPTATQTLTPTDTATPTETQAPPPTATPTQTPTNTPTVTNTPASCGQVDPTLSTVTVTNATQWADGVQAATVTVLVFDNCGQPVSGMTVALVSSRGGLDTIIFLMQTGNQFVFLVTSVNVGASTLTAIIDPAGLYLAITQTGTATFVCVSGNGSPLAFFPQDVQYGFGNPQDPPPPLTHTLRALTVTWNDQGGARKLMTVKMGATVIWSSGSGVTSPFTINVADWTSISRTINPGTSRSLVLSYNVSAAGGTYTLNPVTWDDGAGSNICASAPVSATR